MINLRLNGLNFQIALELQVKFHLLMTLNSDTLHSMLLPLPARPDQPLENEDYLISKINYFALFKTPHKQNLFIFKLSDF